MTLRSLLTVVLFGSLLSLATAQPQKAPAFEVADVHPSPPRSYPFFFAALSRQGRYVLHDATMVDLIAIAWGFDRENVQGGPSWLELDRFDITAKVAPDTPADVLKLMLRGLLAERFKLTFHAGSKAMPAFVLSAPKGSSRLKHADADGTSGCDDKTPARTPGSIVPIQIFCHNMSMDALVQQLHETAGGYLDKPVVNSTGLEGQWEFEIRWTGRGQLAKAGADGISIFEAVEKQLGLKLELQTAPRPVILVDHVSENPTPNVAGFEEILPRLPVPLFEVATLKPTKPGTSGSGRINGDQVSFTDAPLKLLISLAWDLNEDNREVIVGAPKWLDDDHYDLQAKVPLEYAGTAGPGGLPVDIYEVEMMVRALLIERFKLRAHMEDRPIAAYTLVSVKPSMRPADPLARTRCVEGPGQDGKDPRLANPVLNRLLSCQNMSTAQLAKELKRLASGYIYGDVLDATGLAGGYDFTLSFSSSGQSAGGGGTAEAGSASDPSGAITLFDAVNRQLGLKLEKQRRPLPVLVIDHIEEKPTEN